MKERHVSISKFLSLVLRHQPEKVGVTLFRSANGVWLTEHVPVRYISFGGDDERR